MVVGWWSWWGLVLVVAMVVGWWSWWSWWGVVLVVAMVVVLVGVY
jgi:hypothetical protein